MDSRNLILPFIALSLGVVASACDSGRAAPSDAGNDATDAGTATDAATVTETATGTATGTGTGTETETATATGTETGTETGTATASAETVTAREAAGRFAGAMAERDVAALGRARRAQAAIDALARRREAERAAAAVSETLVWGELEGDMTITFRVTRRGDELLVDTGSAVDAVVVTDAGVWQWQTRATHPRLSACEIGEGEMMPPERARGDAMRGEMVRLDRGLRSRERQVVVAASRADGANELAQRATIAGSVGPYVFAIDSVLSYECGAHGNSAASLVVWDLRTGSAVQLADAAGVAALRDALAPAGMQSIRAEMRADGMPDDALFDDRAELSAVLPFFDARGRLGAEAHFTAGACYACGDEEWGSYSRSAHVRTRDVPALLRDVPLDTAAVALVAAEEPKLRIHGASTVTRPSAALTRTLDAVFAFDGC